jgi:hypothetical protein
MDSSFILTVNDGWGSRLGWWDRTMCQRDLELPAVDDVHFVVLAESSAAPSFEHRTSEAQQLDLLWVEAMVTYIMKRFSLIAAVSCSNLWS